MHKPSQNIAIIFCLIFLFPIIWQSGHQFNHALQHRYHSCTDDLQYAVFESECAICSYEFAKCEESSDVTWLPQPVFFSFRFHTEIIPCLDSFRGFHFCLRAPPLT